VSSIRSNTEKLTKKKLDKLDEAVARGYLSDEGEETLNHLL
jgi:hypothetical protein